MEIRTGFPESARPTLEEFTNLCHEILQLCPPASPVRIQLNGMLVSEDIVEG